MAGLINGMKPGDRVRIKDDADLHTVYLNRVNLGNRKGVITTDTYLPNSGGELPYVRLDHTTDVNGEPAAYYFTWEMLEKIEEEDVSLEEYKKRVLKVALEEFNSDRTSWCHDGLKEALKKLDIEWVDAEEKLKALPNGTVMQCPNGSVVIIKVNDRWNTFHAYDNAETDEYVASQYIKSGEKWSDMRNNRTVEF